MTDEDRFLRRFCCSSQVGLMSSYIVNKGWVDQEKSIIPAYKDLVAVSDDEEDEELDEMADKYEAAYNFRFEEPYGFFCCWSLLISQRWNGTRDACAPEYRISSQVPDNIYENAILRIDWTTNVKDKENEKRSVSNERKNKERMRKEGSKN